MTIEYHEPPNELTENTRKLHRAFATLVEEIEAVDWYQERIDVTVDQSMVDILRHNRNEEMEHAAMTLEWIRRNEPAFDERLRTYLFTEAPITELEEEGEGKAEGVSPAPESDNDGSLGLGQFSRS